MKKNKVIEFLLILTVFSLPLYFLKATFWGIPSNWLEIMAVITICASFLLSREKWPRVKLVFPFAIGMIIVGLTLSGWKSREWMTAAGIIKSWFIVPIIFSYAVLRHKDEKLKARMINTYIFSAGLVSLISLVYAIVGFLTYDQRLKGFYLSPNHLAMYLAPAVIAGAYLLFIKAAKLFHSQTSGLKYFLGRYFFILIFSLILTAFYLTYSYAAWLSVMAAISACLVLRFGLFHNRKIVYLIAIAFLLLVTQLQNDKFINQFAERSSWQSRMIIWRSAIKITTDNPFLGIGPGNFQDKYLEYQRYFPPYLEWAVPQPHNLYLAFWLQSGIIGLSGFIILVAFWLYNILSRALKNKYPADILLSAFIIYILFHGLIDTPIWKNDLAYLFWIIIALGIKKIPVHQESEI